MQIHVGGGIENTVEEAIDRAFGADLRKAKGDLRVIVRPDRAIMMGHWIVADFAARHRTNAPPGEEIGRHQRADAVP